MSQSTMLHVRVDTDLKEQATATLAKIGMPLSDAIRLFLNRVVIEQELPLTLKVPNEETLLAIQQADAMFKNPNQKWMTSFEELERALNTSAK